MARTVSIGRQDFEKLIRHNNFYVDKTRFIREWWENDDEVTLITRPRRFGKTLTMSMLECFFSLEYAGKGELFSSFNIWEDETYRELQGSYPVINLSFADVKGTTYEEAQTQICQIISDLYEKNAAFKDSSLLSEREKAEFDQISAHMPKTTAQFSLRKLCSFMQRHFGKKVIILLDEYDTPIQEAYVNGYWEELVSFVRNLFNSTFKTNPYLERAILTGITRVSKESIFSDLNNLKVITTTSRKYADCFGFTQEEVTDALAEYGFSDKEAEVKYWYDGFTFGNNSNIYNPWSITNFLDEGKFDTYWANTSSNSLVNKLIMEGSPDVKQTTEELLRGGALHTPIDEQIVFHQLNDGNEEYVLKLTNNEVRRMFTNMIHEWFCKSGVNYNF